MQKIPVIQPVKSFKEFASIDEFNVFYNDHRDEFERETTCMLNKRYKIPGFRITKIQGEVKLKNIPESRKTALDRVNAAQDRILMLEEKMNSFIDAMNDIVDKCNTASQEVKALKKKVQELENTPRVVIHETPKPEPKPEPVIEPPRPVPKREEPREKQKFDDNGPNVSKPVRRPGQMMDTALAWLNGG